MPRLFGAFAQPIRFPFDMFRTIYNSIFHPPSQQSRMKMKRLYVYIKSRKRKNTQDSVQTNSENCTPKVIEADHVTTKPSFQNSISSDAGRRGRRKFAAAAGGLLHHRFLLLRGFRALCFLWFVLFFRFSWCARALLLHSGSRQYGLASCC